MVDRCAHCGMQCAAGAYHPMAACLMFLGGKNSKHVEDNLRAVLLHGREDLRGELRYLLDKNPTADPADIVAEFRRILSGERAD